VCSAKSRFRALFKEEFFSVVRVDRDTDVFESERIRLMLYEDGMKSWF